MRYKSKKRFRHLIHFTNNNFNYALELYSFLMMKMIFIKLKNGQVFLTTNLNTYEKESSCNTTPFWFGSFCS